ncbi:RHS repeat-associated core domain-containing protein, partial [Caballeronia sp. LZ033]|uniref:RHS repeat domain-containing protein n=1 Tax=Caballeronia sp. LZ033 TaxID=3038566 RepID=UPI00285C3506
GRLVGFENTHNERWAYRYDALGRRIGKRATEASWHGKHSQHGSQTWFLWDGDAMAGEVRSAANKHDTARFYAYHLGSFEPLAMQTKSASSKHLYFYQNDPNGAPVRLRNTNGEIVWEVHYGVTGGVDRVETERIEQPIRLQGQYEDHESGLRYNRHRYFDPQTASFISQDPIGLLGGTHPYQFAPNTVGWADPLGLTCVIAKTKALAATLSDAVKARFHCQQFAGQLKELMKDNGIAGEHLRIELGTSGNLISDMHGIIAEGAKGSGPIHEFIRVGDVVFDNMNPSGISYSHLMNDLGLDVAPTSIYRIVSQPW